MRRFFGGMDYEFYLDCLIPKLSYVKPPKKTYGKRKEKAAGPKTSGSPPKR
jgi:hypothetical protein